MASIPPIGDHKRIACLGLEGWRVGKEVKIENIVSLLAQITSDLAWFRISPRRGAWLLIRARYALISSSVSPRVLSSR